MKYKEMRYQVGDKVKIKSLVWYNENINEVDEIPCGSTVFIPDMVQYISDIVTISEVFPTLGTYRIKEDSGKYNWTDEMIECKVEDTIATNEQMFELSDISLATNEQLFELSNISLEKEMELNLPDGYIFKDENGNVINTTKIVLEKKKPKYPTTYEECAKVLGYDDRETYCIFHTGADERLFEALYRLKVCRDAYWKIAGEEMGLGKPWEPDFDNEYKYKYGLFRLRNIIYKDATCINPTLLIFPTEEMRDAFYENFKEEIEFCKELL